MKLCSTETCWRSTQTSSDIPNSRSRPRIVLVGILFIEMKARYYLCVSIKSQHVVSGVWVQVGVIKVVGLCSKGRRSLTNKTLWAQLGRCCYLWNWTRLPQRQKQHMTAIVVGFLHHSVSPYSAFRYTSNSKIWLWLYHHVQIAICLEGDVLISGIFAFL